MYSHWQLTFENDTLRRDTVTSMHASDESLVLVGLFGLAQPLEVGKVCIEGEVKGGFVRLSRVGELRIEYDVREMCGVEQAFCSSMRRPAYQLLIE